MVAEARPSGASVANANALAQDDANIAFIQNDIAYYAYNDLYMFNKNKVDMRGSFPSIQRLTRWWFLRQST
ncbi:MAG: hypothetical protein AT707_01465 [Pyrobaculum sp. JCHS_4]|nr:MAG: hypothetical protein AT707_01465 [Pyrobaculum sp. JCHS_4]